MSPREFFDQVLRPDADDFERNFGDLRSAHHAIASADAMFAHIYAWLKANAPTSTSARNDLEFRDQIAASDPDVALLRDLAKAQKHVEPVRGRPMVRRADQVSIRSTGWGEGRWG